MGEEVPRDSGTNHPRMGGDVEERTGRRQPEMLPTNLEGSRQGDQGCYQAAQEVR